MDGCLTRYLQGKNSVNAIIGVGMFLGSSGLKSLNNIMKIQPRMMCASFNGNLCTTIISCYSPTNDETDIITFYNKLSFLAWPIPKLILIIGDLNA